MAEAKSGTDASIIESPASIIEKNALDVIISGLLVFVGVVAYWWLASPCHYGESRSLCQQDACSGLAMPCLSDTSRDHSPNLLNVCAGLGKMTSGFSSAVILILAGRLGLRVTWKRKKWRDSAWKTFGLAWRIGVLWILLTSIGELVAVKYILEEEFNNRVFTSATELFLRNVFFFGGAFMLVHAGPSELKKLRARSLDSETVIVLLGATGSLLGGIAALAGLYGGFGR